MTEPQRTYRILFVQKRFHTNQYYAMKTLVERGHTVKYIATMRIGCEDHSITQADVLPDSRLVRAARRLGLSLTRNSRGKGKKSIGTWSPWALYKSIRRFRADVIIVKRYRRDAKYACLIARLLGVPTIRYDQKPQHARHHQNPKSDDALKRRSLRTELKEMAKGGVRNWFWKKFQPTTWYTPIKGSVEHPADHNAVHVWFPIETPADVSSRSYMPDGKVRMICVGRYGMTRKRLQLLLEAVNMLKDSYDFSLTIIGTGSEEKSGYKQLASYVRENGLDGIVTLKLNLAFKEVLEEYGRHDLYVLPSIDEPYSGSILEAMSRGLGAICTETNQAKDLIDERTGAVCRPDDVDDLRRKLEAFLAEPQRVERAGRAAGEIAATRHHPDAFHQSFVKLMERAIGGKADEITSSADHWREHENAIPPKAPSSSTGFSPESIHRGGRD